tara:strand:+ start:72 stop:269 length:198 start_codon:yes stop_codon:yes gene_type:complete
MGLFKKLKKKRKKTKEEKREEKIMSDPTLKKLYAKLEKDGEQLKKDNDKVLKMLGIDSPKKKKLP